MIQKIQIINFISGPLAEWLPIIFFSAIFFLAVFLYFGSKALRAPEGLLEPLVKRFRLLIISVVIFRVFYAGFLSSVQYYIWSHNNFTRFFLPPHQSIKYFFHYSWTHFWFSEIIIFAISLILFLFFAVLKKYRDYTFEDGEAELAALMTLIVGWPNFVVFLPLAFIFTIIISLGRLVIFKNQRVSLGLPFILAALVVLSIGGWLINILHLGYLRI